MSLPPPRSSLKSVKFAKYVPIFTLLLPAICSAALIITHDTKIYGRTRSYVESNRTTISVLVQVASSVLGILQISTLTSIIDFATRVRLHSTAMRLDTIGLMTAFSVPRIPWNLPISSVCLASIMVAAAQGPGALWAGALTPIFQTNALDGGVMQIPAFTDGTVSPWDRQFDIREGYVWNMVDVCSERRSNQSTISNCPVPNHQGLLLDTARRATTPTGNPRNHSKVDNPGWTYTGRSCGMGTSPGLARLDGIPASHRLLGYTYHEAGYLTSVHCQHNSTSQLSALRRTVMDEVQVWALIGSLPNSIHDEFYPIITWFHEKDENAEFLAWAGVSNNDSHMIGIVTTDYYGDFKHIQCSVDFEPTMFAVSVNITEQSIDVTRTGLSTGDIDTTGHLRRNAVLSINFLSRMSTSLYLSVLGEALQFNTRNIKLGNPSLDDREAALRATAASFEAMIDDIFEIYGGAQLALAADSIGVTISGQYRSMVFGRTAYQYAVAGINLALLVLIVVEAVRTQWWRTLPMLDILDFKSVVAVSSFGGKSIASAIETHCKSLGTKWVGQSSDRQVGGLKVQLEETPRALALVLSEGYEMAEYPTFSEELDVSAVQTAGSGVSISDSPEQVGQEPQTSYFHRRCF